MHKGNIGSVKLILYVGVTPSVLATSVTKHIMTVNEEIALLDFLLYEAFYLLTSLFSSAHIALKIEITVYI